MMHLEQVIGHIVLLFGITEFVKIKLQDFTKKEIDAFAKTLFKTSISHLFSCRWCKKVSSKISLLNNIIPKVNKIIIGGAMSNTFLKTFWEMICKAHFVEDEFLAEAKTILENAKKIWE